MVGHSSDRAQRAPWLRIIFAAVLALSAGWPVAAARSATETDEMRIALDLANLLRSARAVISSKQDLINDPAIGDKGLTGDAVLADAMERYAKNAGTDPESLDRASRHGRLLRAQMAAIVEVMDENQNAINQTGIGFKGFVPAIFARLVNERFEAKVGDEAEMKVTAPMVLVRNRRARPDPWEDKLIQEKLLSPDWPKEQIYASAASERGREAFRVLVPEYYTAGCLICHGEPKGEIDITGYPKEGGALGDLGGVISITLFR